VVEQPAEARHEVLFSRADAGNWSKKGLDFPGQQSVTVCALGSRWASRHPALPAVSQCGVSVVTALNSVTTERRIPMKLSDTQLMLLSAASQRADYAVVPTAALEGAPGSKILSRLLRERLLEEVPANGVLPAWRRHATGGPLALRITDRGLALIGVSVARQQRAAAEPSRATKAHATGKKHLEPTARGQGKSKASSRPDKTDRSRSKQTGARPRTPAKKRTGAADKAEVPRSKQAQKGDLAEKTGSGSKQSRVIAMLQSPAGATIAAIMKVTGWQQHSVRGFLAGVVRKRLKLKLSSNKVDGDRIYEISRGGSDNSNSRQLKRSAA
jgi:hypothetical protein